MASRGAHLMRRPIAVTSWCVAVVLAGIWTAADIPVEYTPDTELPQVRIFASWPGASPRMIERYVAAPIEREMQTIPGVAKLQSVSEENQAYVTVDVDEDTDLSAFATQASDKLALLRETLPDRVVPNLTKQIPEAFRDVQGFMTLQVVGPATPDALRRMAEEDIKPRIQNIPGIDLVDVHGGTERELLISLDPDRLAAYDISPQRVGGQLREAMRDRTYGRLASQGRNNLLFSKPSLDVDGLAAVIVSDERDDRLPVRLDQVAQLGFGPAPRRTLRRIDGLPVVTLELERTRGSHMIQVAQAVHDRIEDLRADLPEGTRIIVAEDRTEDVRELLDDLAWRGGLGLILVVFVLLFMLKSVRATLVVLLSVAVAIAPALALFRWFGLSLNIITLAGLVLVFGLLVDNSVVVVEQLTLQQRRYLRHGLNRLSTQVSVARAALKAVWVPLLGGTLSTMAVMLPLVYLSGDLRDLFLPFGALVSLTLFISLASAALVVPVLSRFLPTVPEPVYRRTLRRWVALPYKYAARFPKLTFLALILVLGLPIWKLPETIPEPRLGWSSASKERFARIYNATLGSSPVRAVRPFVDPALGGVVRPFFRNAVFYEPWDYGERRSIPVSMTLPPGSTIERTDSLMQRFEQTALASESVYRTITRIAEQSAYMTVEFHTDALLQAEPYILQRRLVREAIQVGGMYIYVGGLIPQTSYSSGGGYSRGGARMVFYGPNYDDLDDLVERFAVFAKRQSRRVVGVNTSGVGDSWVRAPSRTVLQFRWDGDAQARAGASAAWVQSQLRPYLNTRHRFAVADLAGDPSVPIRLIMDRAEQIDVDRLAQLPLALSDSAYFRLHGVSDYSLVTVPAQIRREDQKYVRYVDIDYRGTFQMTRQFQERLVETFAVPPGYSLEMSSGFFFREENRRALSWVYAATLLLVFLVTAAVFESWRLPLVVMLSVPLAAVGVCLGFLFTGASFVEGAFIGAVLLTGIAVNDSILLTDRFRRLRNRYPWGRATILARMAVRERLRPMWTTTLTSAAAMLPLLVFPDQGDFWTGLAVTVTGGLLASTLLAPLASVAMLSMSRR